MRSTLSRERGVSLVEAMVAFAIMAFGMLAVVGMQATLRTNADLARQRSEAVRLAQDAIEEWRGITTASVPLTPGTQPRLTAYEHVVTLAPDEVSTIALPQALSNGWTETPLNTTYTIKRTVNDEPVLAGVMPAVRKLMVVEVTWKDRNSEDQFVRLSTSIAWMDPALEGSLILTANAQRVLQPNSRNRAIPPGAKNLGQGHSGWVPPGQTPVNGNSIAWVFDNITGDILRCLTPASTTAALDGAYINGHLGTVCGYGGAKLVSGFLRYDGTTPPDAMSVANPDFSYIPDLTVTVELTSGYSTPCYKDAASFHGAVAYYCAVPVGDVTNPGWTGAITFADSAPTAPIPAMVATASSPAGDLPGLFKVCRYPGVELNHVAQITPLVNQNFVFITAGDGGQFYACPTPTVSDYQPITTP